MSNLQALCKGVDAKECSADEVLKFSETKMKFRRPSRLLLQALPSAAAWAPAKSVSN